MRRKMGGCMTAYYPVYLNLRGRRCVIVGGGTVAEGKISPAAGLRRGNMHRQPRRHARHPAVRGRRGGALGAARVPALVTWKGAFIAIAATNVREVNRRIFEEANRRGVMLNAVDDPPNCSFIAPSIVQRGPVTLAISTNGMSPALARKLRESLQDSEDLAWADLSGVMATTRACLREMGMLDKVAPERWQSCITPQLLAMAQEGKEEEAVEVLLAGLLGDSQESSLPIRSFPPPRGEG